MHPIITQIGPICVYSYGLMVAIGFAIVALLAYRQAPEFGLDREKVIDFTIAVLIGGIAGARIFYVLAHFKYYISNPIEVINITKGGLVWYGGLLAGILIAVWFTRRNKINFWDGADLLAPYLALAQAMGRIGCFLNGCCYGSPAGADFLFGVVFPGETVLRHPVQIYSAVILIAIFVILKIWQNSRHFKGEIFLGYCMLSSLARFALEFLRGDSPRVLICMTPAQIISGAIFKIGLVIFIFKLLKWKKNP